MGRTNLKASLETKLSQVLGELQAAEKEFDQLRAGLKKLISLRQRIAELREVARSAETILRSEYPNWTPVNIKPTRAGAWKNPLRAGDLGKTALETLRELDEWARPRELAALMLAKVGHDQDDADALHRVANSVGTYFKKYESELVEARGDFAKEWRIISR
jgi:hypothetical protein